VTQLPLFRPKAAWRPPRLSDLPSWATAKRVAVDVETRDPSLKTLGPGVRRGAYIVGISFAIEDGPAVYLPIAHPEDNVDKEAALAYLREQAAVFRGDLCNFNLGYDIDFLAQVGIEYRPRFFRDAQIADALINELHDSYSLESVAQRHGFAGKDTETLYGAATAWNLANPRGDLWKLPARYVGAYAEQDARLPLLLLRRQEREIERQDLQAVYDLESRLLPALVAMRRRGVRVDLGRLRKVDQFAEEEINKSVALVTSSTGVRVTAHDISKSALLAKALAAVGVIVPQTKTGKPSVTKDWLKAVDHPVAHALVRARKFDRVRGTFVESIRKHAVGDRIHTTFNQLPRAKDNDADEEVGEDGGIAGARYGRMSCSKPNLQNQPTRDPEIGKMWRSIFVPDGELWASCDYSQQEPRMLVHYAEGLGLPRAAELGERFRTSSVDFHQAMADITSLPRDPAKTIFLGMCYGMGGAKLCRSLGLPTVWSTNKHGLPIEVAGPEGEALITRFDQMVPFVRQLSRLCEQQARAVGFIRTIYGRRCRFPLTEHGFDWTRKALNRLIQGSSADQTKLATVLAHERGIPLQLQIHDELTLSVDARSEVDPLADLMRTCLVLRIPSRVTPKLGPSWGEAV